MRRILLLLGIIVVLVISGCTQTGQVTNIEPNNLPTVPKYQPANINIFESVVEGEIIRFYFFLEDQNGQNTVSDGQADVQIKDSSGKVVFIQKFSFKASNFQDYQFLLTGQEAGKAYEWRINQTDIQKGISSRGTADLTLTMADDKILKSTADYVQIPSYTEEEKYDKNAKVSGVPIIRGNFEVTLVKYGFYTHLKHDTWGDEVTDFRADIKVKNIGTISESFNIYDASMIAGTNQYSYGGKSDNFDTSGIYPGVIKEGYILYEDVPKNLTGGIKLIVGSSYYRPIDMFVWENILYTFDIIEL